ncbi:MAG: hypothetical protein J5589_00220 [Firmicutes bacterium]|nr:hypothetical protein [Bacillota bacterium]
MNNSIPGSDGVQIGQGTVSEIQTSIGLYAGHALVESYIPEGWKVTTNAPEREANLLCPLTVQVMYRSPEEDASIIFTGTRAFKHLDPTPQNAQWQGQMQDRVIRLSFQSAQMICGSVLQQNQSEAENLQILSEENEPDAWAISLGQKRAAESINAGMLEPGSEWYKITASFADRNGQHWCKQVETLVTYAYQPVSQTEQMLYQMALQSQARKMNLASSLAANGRFAGLVAGLAEPQIPAPQPKLLWTVQYILETCAPEAQFPDVVKNHDRIRESIKVLPLFEQERDRLWKLLFQQQQQDDAIVNQALSQMNQQQMASWDRKQQIIQNTSNYENAVMHQMFQSNAETNQKVSNLQSEAIRGVNSFYTNSFGYGVPPVVEADIGWDHVYQNMQFPDQFATSTGAAPADFGVDFEELKKTDGAPYLRP